MQGAADMKQVGVLAELDVNVLGMQKNVFRDSLAKVFAGTQRAKSSGLGTASGRICGAPTQNHAPPYPRSSSYRRGTMSLSAYTPGSTSPGSGASPRTI